MPAPFAPFEIIFFDQRHGTFIRDFFPVHNDFNPVFHVCDNPDLENVGDAFDIVMSGEAVIYHIIPLDAFKRAA